MQAGRKPISPVAVSAAIEVAQADPASGPSALARRVEENCRLSRTCTIRARQRPSFSLDAGSEGRGASVSLRAQTLGELFQGPTDTGAANSVVARAMACRTAAKRGSG